MSDSPATTNSRYTMVRVEPEVADKLRELAETDRRNLQGTVAVLIEQEHARRQSRQQKAEVA